MSFDINPLGNTLYLQQLEREVSELRARKKAGGPEKVRDAARPAATPSWIGLLRRAWQARPAAQS